MTARDDGLTASLWDVNPMALLAFADSASAFNVAGLPIDRNALAADVGLDWQVAKDIGWACPMLARSASGRKLTP